MDGRRALSFADLGEVMPEVDRLMFGYRSVGTWTLGQACNHLADTLRCSLEGFGDAAPWLVRKLIGPIVKRQVFRTGKMRAGIKVPERYLPAPGLDDRAEVEALRASLRLYSESNGPFAQHPFFGELTRDDWHRLHCIHAAHHLGFLLPEPVAVA